MKYLIKRANEADANIRIELWIENRFAICDVTDPTKLEAEFAVEIPQDQYEDFYLYHWSNGKRHRALLTDKIAMVGPDATGRWQIQYTPEQLTERTKMLRWVAVNAFVPDMIRMGKTDNANVLLAELNALNTDEEIKQYTVDKLYYDL